MNTYARKNKLEKNNKTLLFLLALSLFAFYLHAILWGDISWKVYTYYRYERKLSFRLCSVFYILFFSCCLVRPDVASATFLWTNELCAKNTFLTYNLPGRKFVSCFRACMLVQEALALVDSGKSACVWHFDKFPLLFGVLPSSSYTDCLPAHLRDLLHDCLFLEKNGAASDKTNFLISNFQSPMEALP